MHWITRRWMAPGVVVFWGVLTGISLGQALEDVDRHATAVATERARMVFSLVETMRLWVARHGGVYAPLTAETPANEWLVDPLRDVEIAGREFTKINPAYMTRQLGELFAQSSAVRVRLTSLKPIRPANAADPWEAGVLQRFERGEREVTELVRDNGEATFRYMGVLLTHAACLHCHANQGYKLGDVRGGISVGIPARLVEGEVAPQRRRAILLHGNVFLILSLMSVVALRHVQESWRRLAAAKAEQEVLVEQRTAQLRQAVGELQRSNTELERFAYIVSHDLQEPLRMVTGYAQLLKRRHEPELQGDARDFLGFMVDGAQRMNAMIADLLAYSRVQRQQPDLQEADVGALLDEALRNLGTAIAESGAVVTRDPLPTLKVDANQMVRLLQNLVGNAVKYRAPERAPAIHVGAAREGELWHLVVRDNGIGIAPEFFDRLFQVFQRLHSRGEYPGNGIGLAICKTIVERHGGRIWVESAPGEGSSFHFTLPG